MIGKIEKEIERIRQIKWWRKDQALQVMTIWKHSEISLLRFCRQYHIGYKHLLRWKRILESQAGSMGFVQVEIPVQPAGLSSGRGVDEEVGEQEKKGTRRLFSEKHVKCDHDRNCFPARLWQLRFHEHIIRNEAELNRIRIYNR